jgi:hypothetical protein
MRKMGIKGSDIEDLMGGWLWNERMRADIVSEQRTEENTIRLRWPLTQIIREWKSDGRFRRSSRNWGEYSIILRAVINMSWCESNAVMTYKCDKSMGAHFSGRTRVFHFLFICWSRIHNNNAMELIMKLFWNIAIEILRRKTSDLTNLGRNGLTWDKNKRMKRRHKWRSKSKNSHWCVVWERRSRAGLIQIVLQFQEQLISIRDIERSRGCFSSLGFPAMSFLLFIHLKNYHFWSYRRVTTILEWEVSFTFPSNFHEIFAERLKKYHAEIKSRHRWWLTSKKFLKIPSISRVYLPARQMNEHEQTGTRIWSAIMIMHIRIPEGTTRQNIPTLPLFPFSHRKRFVQSHIRGWIQYD